MPSVGAAPAFFLQPCRIFVHREEHLVTTILGSCVSVFLWDSRMGMGGVNHYMLPLWNGEGLPTPKFGNIAIQRLLRAMLDHGCLRERLSAKVFGGGNTFPASQGLLSVGDRNIDVARAMLAQESIALAAEDVGDATGRKIICNTRTGVVLVSRLARSHGGLP